MRISTVALALLMAAPADARAQAAQPSHDPPIPLLVVQGFGLQRIAAGASWLMPFGKQRNPDGYPRQKAVMVQATAGLGGFRAGGGLIWLRSMFGPDLQVTFTRTTSLTTDATPDANYVGLEAGYVWMVIKPTIAFEYRLSSHGLPEHRRQFKVGVMLLLPFWEL